MLITNLSGLLKKDMHRRHGDRRLFMKIKERLKQLLHDYIPSIIVTAALIALVFAAIFAQTAGIVSFIVVDCVVGYLYRNNITCKKALLQIKYNHSKDESDENKKEFNSEYYDLYQEVYYNRLMVMLKSICLALTFCPLIYKFFGNNMVAYISISLVIISVFLFTSCIFLSVGKKNEVLMELISKRKGNWEGNFTSEELEILSKLNPKKQS